MNDIYVFLGPTLAEKDARAELDAVYLPPVSAGDVYRLWRRGPRAVGIVDGYFDRVPAVWHKEIMWIMERGVHVFGAAGLGALRAAELDRFGMRGVGWVYQAFRDETLARDDEVAVGHGSEAIEWYFTQRRGTAVPDDLADYAQSCGFPGEQAFRTAVRREYEYVYRRPQLRGDMP